MKALKSAARRLPSDRQSFIAIQFEDITVADLAQPHFRCKLAILAGELFRGERATHVLAIYHCAYAGQHRWPGRIAKPAVVIWRDTAVSPAALPFGDGLDYPQFSRRLELTR